MILGWSPYSGAGEGPPKAAVDYLLGAAVQKRIGSAPETLRRDPPPELLADYNFHSAIANLIYKAGGTVFLLGLVAIPFVWKMAKGKKRD